MRNRNEAREKAKKLVAQMTLEEKASQLRFDAPAIERLGIPEYNWWNEALHGIARAGSGTVFPQAVGIAAAFDDELVKRVGEVVSTEVRAKYNAFSAKEDRDIYKGLTVWSPNVNIFRDPRWGRGHETYGEDPYLTSRLGVAYVNGLQGDGDTIKAAACAKHFAVHSGPESLRHEFNAEASLKDMYETYLPAFEALVKEAGVESVMGAYNRTNSEVCCGSPTLIGKILRGDWGFEGHFVSDCWAIRDFHETHKVTATFEESAALAISEGCDVNCGNTYLHLMEAVEQGLVTEEQIETAAVRLFTTRFLLGCFDGSEYDDIPYEKVECAEHLALAEEVATKSITLLKNDGILPLDKKQLKSVAVVGPNANSRLALMGNYHGTASRYITVLEGMQDALEPEVRVFFSEGSHLWKDRVENLGKANDRVSEAVIAAEHSDVVIAVVGLDETLEGEQGDTGNSDASGDKVDLELPASQRILLDALYETGKPVIVCLMTGSAINLSKDLEKAAAILQLWYPGARGGRAAASIILGEKSPSGKLPVTFYRSTEELPEFTDYSMKGRTYRYMEQPALFPFGYGLTYGKTEALEASVKESEDGGADLTVSVQNSGAVDTEDVLQVYIKAEGSVNAVPNTSLCGMKRVSLSAGEKKEVTIHIAPLAFTTVDETGARNKDAKQYILYAGFGQPDARTEELTGTKAVSVIV